MDFSKFKAVDSANTRKAGSVTKEQTFEDLRYRKVTKGEGAEAVTEGRFYVSNARFVEWGIENETAPNGLKQFVDPETGGVLLALVAEKDATILKKKENAKKKGRNFKAVRVEMALEKLGMIDTKSDASQYIKLTEVAKDVTIDGISCAIVYSLSVGAKKEKPAKAVAAEAAVAPAAPVAEAPKTDAVWN